jgi:hypothetical protein
MNDRSHAGLTGYYPYIIGRLGNAGGREMRRKLAVETLQMGTEHDGSLDHRLGAERALSRVHEGELGRDRSEADQSDRLGPGLGRRRVARSARRNRIRNSPTTSPASVDTSTSTRR